MPAARKFLISFFTGAVMVSSAWAGASLLPVSGDEAQAPVAQTAAAAAPAPAAPAPKAASEPPQAAAALPAPPPDPSSLAAGQVLAGAAKTSIAPRPQDYDGTWERSKEKCATLSEDALAAAMDDPAEFGDHLASAGSPWPENPSCIYMGGYGIGPMNPISSWNESLGLWVRALALRDRQGDDLVLVVLDGEGYFWDYNNKCDDCGVKQLTAQLAGEQALGLEAKNIVVAATHSHTAPDFIGGWGFVPDWYMKQVSETIKSTVRDAMASMQPAVLEYGEAEARRFNRERRSTYRSAEEQNLAWLRAYAPAGQSNQGETIATLGAYAAHPVTADESTGQAHPDWPGQFAARLEERFGGVGMHFMTGLGNLSPAGLGGTGANDLADLVADLGEGDRVEDPDIKTARTTWNQPATNVPLTALGRAGFFDRRFTEGPATVQTGKDPSKFQCVSSSPVGAEVPVSAARIGNELAFTAAPGETFSNFSNTLKEQSGATVTFPFGQANDALGYMPQSFEHNSTGGQGLGFVGQVKGYALINYEDAYAVDRCFGDMALETTIGLLRGLQ